MQRQALMAWASGLVLALAATIFAAEEGRTIDAGTYPDEAAARSAWQPMDKSDPVQLTDIAGQSALRFPCRFANNPVERASWDRNLKADLAEAKGVRFEFHCADTTPVSHFALYLRSKGGWYSTTFAPGPTQGWHTITLDKEQMRIEGSPAGWGQIDGLRLSAWRGGQTDTSFAIRNLSIVTAPAQVAIVRAESLTKSNANEMQSAFQFAESVGQRLTELGIPYVTLSDLDLSAPRLANKKLVILPHNPGMTDATTALLVQHLQQGGKLLGFYAIPQALRQAIGIDGGQHVANRARFASMRAVPAADVKGLPPVVAQSSWNIHQSKPIPGRSRVIAEWYDRAGQPTGEPAVILSDNAAVVTHVLLPDDEANKRALLMALCGTLVPDLWATAASTRIAQIKQSLHQDNLGAESKGAEDLLAQADALAKSGDFVQAMHTAELAEQRGLEALCRAQRPVSGEYRAFWCHSAFGVEGMDWDAAIKTLADNGFTAIHPNMLWGGVAYYPSDVLPVAAEVSSRGDQIAQCLAACRKYGLQIHVWKVNWHVGYGVPKPFLERLRRDGRLQVDASGKTLDQWLCPSSEGNRQLDVNAMVEVARKYPVDGIHFDYIRYPGPEGCFCPRCRAQFERQISRKIENWPQDVQRGELKEQWLQFRRDLITQVVAAVSDQARQARPGIQISAAVFSNWSTARDQVGQDWKLWCERGYLDFVCPMDYTPYTAEFQNLVRQQQAWAGKARVYPGIGLSVWGAKGDLRTLFDQIQVTRQAKTGGFILFNYGPREAQDIVPKCGLGVTRKE